MKKFNPDPKTRYNGHIECGEYKPIPWNPDPRVVYNGNIIDMDAHTHDMCMCLMGERLKSHPVQNTKRTYVMPQYRAYVGLKSN